MKSKVYKLRVAKFPMKVPLEADPTATLERYIAFNGVDVRKIVAGENIPTPNYIDQLTKRATNLDPWPTDQIRGQGITIGESHYTIIDRSLCTEHKYAVRYADQLLAGLGESVVSVLAIPTTTRSFGQDHITMCYYYYFKETLEPSS